MASWTRHLRKDYGGESWTAANVTDLGNLTIQGLVIDPSNPKIVYARTYDGKTKSRGLYKSIDAGGSWTVMDAGLGWLGYDNSQVDIGEGGDCRAAHSRGAIDKEKLGPA